MKPNNTLDPSDLFYQLLDLAELMQATYDILHEMEYVRPDGSRNEELDRVAALQRIACRDIKSLRDAAQVFDGPAEWVQIDGERNAVSAPVDKSKNGEN
ncbi:MAG: hypothetical protein QHC90_17845 [Shinella sp.]|jgi:hypothetical protein|nr:hypothetical protein [Shinella sp.]